MGMKPIVAAVYLGPRIQRGKERAVFSPKKSREGFYDLLHPGDFQTDPWVTYGQREARMAVMSDLLIELGFGAREKDMLWYSSTDTESGVELHLSGADMERLLHGLHNARAKCGSGLFKLAPRVTELIAASEKRISNALYVNRTKAVLDEIAAHQAETIRRTIDRELMDTLIAAATANPKGGGDEPEGK